MNEQTTEQELQEAVAARESAEPTRVYSVDMRNQKITEMVQQAQAKNITLAERQIPYPHDHRGRITVDHEEMIQEAALTEAGGASLSTNNFPDALRMGLIFDAWTQYNETSVTYPQWARVVDSNKQFEEYLLDSPVGLLPVVEEGMVYPEATTDFSHGVKINNYKYGYILSVTEEMQMFDQVGKVRELGELAGRSARLTEEQRALDVITTSGNYTRNSTTGDNDEGANQAAVTFSAVGLIQAFNTLRTMKDRKTAVYLGVNPNTIIVSPKLWWATKALLTSPEMLRQGGNTTNEVYGTGSQNPFVDSIKTIIVTPYFNSTYGWCMMEAGRAVTFQRVNPIQILQQGKTADNTSYFERDVLRYRVRTWFGVGMRDKLQDCPAA